MQVYYPDDYAGLDGTKAGGAHLLAARMPREAVTGAAEIMLLDQLVSDLMAVEAIPPLQLMPAAGLE